MVGTMALGKKKPTLKAKASAWLAGHNALACAGVGVGVAVVLVGLFLFVVFSGFGSSADFIYNQF